MGDKRICIIGAGPSGMATLFQFAKLDGMPDVVCFEKQKTWGGLWNTSWKTGVDEHGEPNHASMYRHLWSNCPKELYELPDYSFIEHFGKPTPSFAPRLAVRDYLEGRWTKKTSATIDLKTFINFSTVVRWVKYDDNKHSYTVVVENLETRETREEIFTHVIVATGIYSTPFLPDIPGMNDYVGRVVHSHNFRDASDFKGQKVLIIGASLSGEDTALQLIKFQAAKKIYLSYKTIPKSAICTPPKEIEEKPLVVRMDANKAYFIDGTEAEVDSVILCTGYKNHFPFLESRFRILEKTSLYPPDLYMGTLFYKVGNNSLFYVGVQLQFYTFTFLEALAIWTCRYIIGALQGEPKTQQEMDEDSQSWVQRANSLVSEDDLANFQASHIDTLVDKSEYNLQLSKPGIFEKVFRTRKGTDGLANYRDHVYTSAYTGQTGLKQTPFMLNFDDSLDAFVNAN